MTGEEEEGETHNVNHDSRSEKDSSISEMILSHRDLQHQKAKKSSELHRKRRPFEVLNLPHRPPHSHNKRTPTCSTSPSRRLRNHGDSRLYRSEVFDSEAPADPVVQA